jgi:RNA polymerase sigma factor (TIGR02999 family)
MSDAGGDDDLTVWLQRMSEGDRQAAEHVASAVYRELHRLAANALSRERRNVSLQPTLLVNEAFLRLLNGQPLVWNDRKHFFSLAARMMRRIIVDYFRGQNAGKRPPRHLQLATDEVVVISDDHRDEALMVDEALNRLSEIDARAAEVVELRYFGGLTFDEVAGVLGVADRTVKRDWEMAQWWLRQYFETGDNTVAADGD